jgi:hypothetical protein
MPVDNFGQFTDSPSEPATGAFVITPHASNELPFTTKAIYIGGAGDLTLRPINGDTDVQFKNLAAGSVLDIRAKAVRASGTSATFLIGLI